MLDARHWFDRELLKMGFPQDYVLTYNQANFGSTVLGLRLFGNTEEDRDDFKWLCNKVQHALRSVGYDGCVDNWRLAKLKYRNDPEPEAYKRARESGCCGSVDFRIVNERTGSIFLLGFNYGH